MLFILCDNDNMLVCWVNNLRAKIIIVMSFRDAFTRSSTSSENLRYDDAAAYHFFITILIIVGLPLGWSIIKTIINPFSYIPNLKEIEKKNANEEKQKIVKE